VQIKFSELGQGVEFEALESLDGTHLGVEFGKLAFPKTLLRILQNLGASGRRILSRPPLMHSSHPLNCGFVIPKQELSPQDSWRS
jgi:hypothetical protein